MRRCEICDEKKSLEEFPSYQKNDKTYYRWQCTSCAPPSKYYKENREEILRKNKERNTKNPEKVMLAAAKQRAKRDNLPFDLEVSDIIIPTFCPILQIPLKRNERYENRKSSPSLDKIIPELGYVKGNVQVISHLANAMKSYATPEELIIFANWVLNSLQEKQNN